MLKTYDTTQAAFIERDKVKRYDGSGAAWVDAKSVKSYDTTEAAWVERLCEYLECTESKVNSSNTNITVTDNGNAVYAEFGDYWTDYYSFTADNLNIDGGSVISFYHAASDTGIVKVRLRVYLSEWGDGTTPYYDIPMNDQSGTYTLTTASNYGTICKIRIDLSRNMEAASNYTDYLRVSNVMVGNKKFKFKV